MSTQGDKLKAIADAIREKEGSMEPITANEFPERIRAIPTGVDVEAGDGITITETAEGKQEIALSQETINSIDGKVSKSGDTMSGALTVPVLLLPTLEGGGTALYGGNQVAGSLSIKSTVAPDTPESIIIKANKDNGFSIEGLTVKPVAVNAIPLYVGTPTENLHAATKAYVDSVAGGFSIASNAGAHNSLFRGKYLGSSVTADQYAAISAGTFDDLFIGDYWTINNINWRIAAFDYYLGTGGTALTTHHAVIVPDTNLDTKNMNDTSVTTGGYVGSKMYTENIATARSKVAAAFSGHVLTHKFYLSNTVANGKVTGVTEVSQDVVLMSERNVYGQTIMSSECNDGSGGPNWYTYDRTQFPLFALAPEFIQKGRSYYWLRDVVSASSFAALPTSGRAYWIIASDSDGVRPAFSIKG